MNPVFMLDEADKLAAGIQNVRPRRCSVLDPAQNHNFRDHYLGVPVDLECSSSRPTSSGRASGPARPQENPLSGYTEEDKLHIARGI
jgi:ATP-dependent Lon protease